MEKARGILPLRENQEELPNVLMDWLQYPVATAGLGKFFFAICNLQFCSSVVVTREVVSGPAFNRKRE